MAVYDILFKEALRAYCFEFLKEKIAGIQLELEQLRESAKNDTKSSMGDKYETSTEMLQQEVGRLMQIKSNYEQHQLLLQKLESVEMMPYITAGSLIDTPQGLIFLSIPLGKIKFRATEIFLISSASPIGKLFLGKNIGDTFQFQHQEYKVMGMC